MKKSKKIIITLVCVCVLSGILLLVNSVFGNPISKFLVKRSVSEYLEENYSDSGFIIEKVGYDFKNMEYYARIVSATDSKEYFYINADSLGQNIDDNYDLYFDENGLYISDYESIEDETENSDQNAKTEKLYINTLNEINYQGPFRITANPNECNDRFFVCDRGLEPSRDRATYTFGITYTNPENNLTETVAVISADYDAEYEDSDFDAVAVEAKIIASNKERVIFAVFYPPVGNSYSYYYNMNTNDFWELQDDTLSPVGNEWYIFEDMFICTTMTLAVGTEMDLYAYGWDGDLLYKRENVLSGYTVSDGWIYFVKAIEKERKSDYIVYRMKLDGTQEAEYYSVSLSPNTDFVVSDETIYWYEDGEETLLDLFTLQPCK